MMKIYNIYNIQRHIVDFIKNIVIMMYNSTKYPLKIMSTIQKSHLLAFKTNQRVFNQYNNVTTINTRQTDYDQTIDHVPRVTIDQMVYRRTRRRWRRRRPENATSGASWQLNWGG